MDRGEVRTRMRAVQDAADNMRTQAIEHNLPSSQNIIAWHTAVTRTINENIPHYMLSWDADDDEVLLVRRLELEAEEKAKQLASELKEKGIDKPPVYTPKPAPEPEDSDIEYAIAGVVVAVAAGAAAAWYVLKD